MNRFVRPVLTFGLSLAYVSVGAYFAYIGKINAETFFTGLSGTALMVVGFWFGERARKPGDKSDG